ncbi:hypothetical protein O181_004859 [Austropuccinia psidii MF-1]|uniref:Uncharacterized protein n=1 Tax=Austropuccinia psidii MF-1 TaxID=1389203 RepID=A0A9Q3GFB4_9BASI|nr:hypothetical protein [Austropuccinia psidii MF-1]
MKHLVFPVRLVEPYHQTSDKKCPSRKKIITQEKWVGKDDLPVLVKKIIKASKITINEKDNRNYLVRFKNKPEDKDKWLSNKDTSDVQIYLRRFRASRREEQSHQL